MTRGRFKKSYLLIELFLLMVALVWILPMISAVQTSLSGKGWENYRAVLRFKLNGIYFLPKMFANSVIVSGITIALVMAVTILAGYAFSKLEFKGRNVLYVAILGCFAIPAISTFLPNTMLIKYMGIRNTYLAMILPMTTINIPISLLIFKNYFDGISDSFLEAATIDGSSRFNTLIKVILPMSTPVVVNILIVLFLYTWNDFTIPLMFTSKQNLFTLTLAPGFFALAQDRVEMGPLYASIILIAVPIIIFYMALQDKIIKGLTLGGVKG